MNSHGVARGHVWLGRPDARLSTLDLIGPGFTLLVRPDGHVAWRAPAGPAAGDELVGALRRILSIDP